MNVSSLKLQLDNRQVLTFLLIVIITDLSKQQVQLHSVVKLQEAKSGMK